MAYYKNVREYLATLEEAGKLVRIHQPVNKDTELHPLVRLQYRGLPEEERKAFLFEKVYDARGRKLDMPVAIACYAGSLDIYALGMQCKKEEIFDKWTRAQSRPIEPVEVASEPAQISGKKIEMPPLRLKEPWVGYESGFWSDRNREEAELALQGKHFETGRRAAHERRRIE